MATFSPDFLDARADAATANAALVIFCRAPRLGEVKTRLARSHGDNFALQIYRAMLRDCFDLGRALAPHAQTFACFTPADAWEQNGELRALWAGAALAQRGEDLGERMLNAFSQVRAHGFERVVIIGSDAPDLPAQYLRDAFDLLRENPVVVGPSDDGGFVLIGASCEVPDAIFVEMTWSHGEVCAHLLDNLRALELDFALLPTWRDVDDAADLEALRARLQDDDNARAAQATREVLRVKFAEIG